MTTHDTPQSSANTPADPSDLRSWIPAKLDAVNDAQGLCAQACLKCSALLDDNYMSTRENMCLYCLDLEARRRA